MWFFSCGHYLRLDDRIRPHWRSFWRKPTNSIEKLFCLKGFRQDSYSNQAELSTPPYLTALNDPYSSTNWQFFPKVFGMNASCITCQLRSASQTHDAQHILSYFHHCRLCCSAQLLIAHKLDSGKWLTEIAKHALWNLNLFMATS